MNRQLTVEYLIENPCVIRTFREFQEICREEGRDEVAFKYAFTKWLEYYGLPWYRKILHKLFWVGIKALFNKKTA